MIGLPGDTVVCCDEKDRITVNGHPLDESSYLYVDSDEVQINPSDVRFEVVVPAGRIFVMGDHRDVSADSRCHLSDLSTTGRKGEVAFVPLDNVVGPAFAVAAPFDRAGRLHRPASFAEVPAPTSRHRPGGDQARGRELLCMPCWCGGTAGSTATSGPCGGSGSTRSPGRTRPGGGRAPVRWWRPRSS